ncbi:hypothetical protein NG796_10810 [Laspinema sp. A4]|nr:hypothetical protein [Laspinema sp. D2d]
MPKSTSNKSTTDEDLELWAELGIEIRPCSLQIADDAYKWNRARFTVAFAQPEARKSRQVSLNQDKASRRISKLDVVGPLFLVWQPEAY